MTQRILPLAFPGLPTLGPGLLALCDDAGRNVSEPCLPDEETSADILVRDLLYGNRETIAFNTDNQSFQSKVIPGRIWGDDYCVGPTKADVMVIGKMPYSDEYLAGKAFCGSVGLWLLDECCRESLDCTNWYVTYLYKCGRTTEEESTTVALKAKWLKEWWPLLHQEIRLVRPKYILAMGTEAITAILQKSTTVKSLAQTFLTFPYQTIDEEGKTVDLSTRVISTLNPKAAILSKSSREQQNFRVSFKTLVKSLKQEPVVTLARGDMEPGLEHLIITDMDDLVRLRKRIDSECEGNLIGADAEWSGSHPQNHNGYLRMVQVSWAEKKAAAIVINDTEGRCIYPLERMEQLRREVHNIFKGKRIAGHFFDADLEWLEYAGFDILSQFTVADTWEQYEDDFFNQRPCGFDTALAIHATDEVADFGLECQAAILTSAPRYDIRLEEWKKRFKSRGGVLEGYGKVPDYILGPYGCYDADVTRRMVAPLVDRLYKDQFDNVSWQPFWLSMRTLRPILEINCTGLNFNWSRYKELNTIYRKQTKKLLEQVREWAEWPDLNLGSSQQLIEFLYGDKYIRKFDSDGNRIRIRPPGARVLGLTPVLTTDKPPLEWSQAVIEGIANTKTPSVNKKAFGLHKFYGSKAVIEVDGKRRRVDRSEQLTWVLEYKLLSQALKYALRSPLRKEVTETIRKGEDSRTITKHVWEKDSRGRFLFSGGIPKEVCDDDRVRTHIYSTKSTGRFSSSRPNLQNLANRGDAIIQKIIGPELFKPLKSLFYAPPGYLYIEADYIGAELFGMAVMSKDSAMLEHVRRNQLPETDPLYYDIHSNIAVEAFRLNCVPTKKGLQSIEKEYLRVLAKAVIFGLAYGRGAYAIASAGKEEGVNLSVDEARAVIRHVFERYPKLGAFLTMCENRAYVERWMRGAFGRYRRFPVTDIKSKLAALGRQAKNFPIQGLVADAVSTALNAFYDYREERNMHYKICLSVHDSITLLVPEEEGRIVYEEAFEECMIKRVPVYPTGPDGNRIGDTAYYLGLDKTIYKEMGIKLDRSVLLS